MEIDHRGLKAGVAHIPLDDAQIHAGFKQVSCIRVPQRVDGDVAFLNARRA